MSSSPQKKIALALLACSDAQIATALDPRYHGENRLLICALAILAVADDYQAASDFDDDSAIQFTRKLMDLKITGSTI